MISRTIIKLASILVLSGFLFSPGIVFAESVCVCTSSDNDCRAVTLPATSLSKTGCEDTCKKELGTKYGSSDYGEGIEGDLKAKVCKETNLKFNAAKILDPITEVATPKATITPTLNIEIPNVRFADAVSEPCRSEGGATCIKSNFLADYLTGIYQFLIIASTSIAIIMLMIGGLQYTLGAANPEMIKKGKTRIHNAITGLILLLGVYLVLYTANPQLTILKTIELQNVAEEVNNYPETVTPRDLIKIGSYTYKYFSECPVPLANQNTYDVKKKNKPGNINKNIPRRVEFHSKIRPLLKGPIETRILMATEAAALCQIHYENCGVATTNMYALAAVPGDFGNRCLANTNPGAPCNIVGISYGNIFKTSIRNALGKKVSVPWGTPKQQNVSNLLKGFWCGSKTGCCPTKKKTESPEYTAKREACYQNIIDRGCIQDEDQARAKLRSILTSVGWSPNWINDLKPGDYYMTVNMNPSCQATHSAMFLGWADAATRKANIEMADANNFIRTGTTTFDESDIIIQISRPVESK